MAKYGARKNRKPLLRPKYHDASGVAGPSNVIHGDEALPHNVIAGHVEVELHTYTSLQEGCHHTGDGIVVDGIRPFGRTPIGYFIIGQGKYAILKWPTSFTETMHDPLYGDITYPTTIEDREGRRWRAPWVRRSVNLRICHAAHTLDSC